MINTALITGASKRIGKAIAEHLAGKGWNIIIHYNHSAEEAEKLVNTLTLKYPNQKFVAIKANLSRTEEVTGLIKNAISELGDFNLLINNASVFNPSYLKDTSVGLFEATTKGKF